MGRIRCQARRRAAVGRSLAAFAVVGVLLSVGCASEPFIWIRADAKPPLDLTYAVGPFEDLNAQEEKLKYPDAAKVVANALESALLRAGCCVVRPSVLGSALIRAGYGAITPGAEDATIVGSVRSYYRGSFGNYTTVAVDVKAIDRKTGVILWQAHHAKRTHWDYKYDPALLANEVTEELVEALRAPR
jgi:hypothetical protein